MVGQLALRQRARKLGRPSGKNIRWKTPVPLPGANSAVVCGRRVFLSGATESRRKVYGFDAASGKLLWHQEVSGPGSNRGAGDFLVPEELSAGGVEA